MFAVLFQSSSNTADIGAVENFGLGLGLVSKAKPREFDPVRCPFFDILRAELAWAGGELNLRSFYEKYAGIPHGMPTEVLSLYLAAFVRLSQPSCYLTIRTEASFTLKDGKRPRDNRLGFADIPLITWPRGKLHRVFERLVQVQGPGWNDFVKYFRELDETLQAATTQEQIVAQQERLGKVFSDWSNKIEAMRKRLVRLAQDLGQDISMQIVAMDTVKTVCDTDPYDLQTFAKVFTEQFESDGRRFKDAIATVRRLEELDRTYVQAISDAVRYLDQIEGLPHGDPLAGERERVRAVFDLIAFCEDPDRAEKALQEFSVFHNEYRARYQRHYRTYREKMAALNVQLKALVPQVQGLGHINEVKDLGMPVGERLGSEYLTLLSHTDTVRLQSGLPDVDERPVVDGVRLDTELPMAEVSRFKSDLEMALLRRLEVLSTPAIRDLLSASAEGNVQDLVAAVDEGDPARVATVFTTHVADKVKALLRSARMVVVDVPLADYGPVQVGDSGDDLAQVVQRFERFLKQRLDAARNLHPGKIVRPNLK